MASAESWAASPGGASPLPVGMEILGFATLAASLAAAGYVVTAPNAESAAIDGPVARRYRCTCCGGRLAYVPMTRLSRVMGEPMNYRAFAVCTACDVADEY